jgi:hypothetical protein
MVQSAPPVPGKAAFLEGWARAPAEGSTLVLVSLADGVTDALARLSPAFAGELVDIGHGRLRACADRPAALYHVDELSVLAVMPDCLSAEALAARLAQIFSEPLTVQGLPIPVRVGIGLRAVEEPGEDAAELLRSALIAVKESSRRPLGWGYYDRAADLDRREASDVAA